MPHESKPEQEQNASHPALSVVIPSCNGERHLPADEVSHARAAVKGGC